MLWKTDNPSKNIPPFNDSNPRDGLNDFIDIDGLSEFAPGSKISLILNHSDGSQDTRSAQHTYNDAQIEWFKAGSALNLIRSQQR